MAAAAAAARTPDWYCCCCCCCSACCIRSACCCCCRSLCCCCWWPAPAPFISSSSLDEATTRSKPRQTEALLGSTDGSAGCDQRIERWGRIPGVDRAGGRRKRRRYFSWFFLPFVSSLCFFSSSSCSVSKLEAGGVGWGFGTLGGGDVELYVWLLLSMASGPGVLLLLTAYSGSERLQIWIRIAKRVPVLPKYHAC
jgi:hypothetical protein